MGSVVKELNKQQKNELKDLFGKWVKLSSERRYYDHDIGVLPSLIRPFLGNTVPAAVVKAMSESDVSKLLKWSNKNNIPVVPRAGASSGYGGIIPSKGGIVLDLTSLRRIKGVDKKNKKATVEAGIVWEDLEKKLKGYNLAPQTVPSSAPASTVGGWFAQGGAGYGSYEYGWFIDSVEKIRMVTGDGKIRELEGDDLYVAYSSMGSLGVITEVTLKLRDFQDIVPVAFEFKDSKSLSDTLKETSSKKVNLYSLNFLNPQGARLKNKVPAKMHHTHKLPKPPRLPEKYIILATATENNKAALEEFEEIATSNRGNKLSREVAYHEWEERYKPMKVKRLGPSLIPAEVVVPLNSLYLVTTELEHKINQDLLLEGIIVKGNEVVLLGLIPHDERSFSYNFGYGLSLSVLKTALKYGGRPYSGGLYFGGYADKVLGSEKLTALKNTKKELDPNHIMNPDKIKGKSSISFLLSTAIALEPVIRAFGNAFKVENEERFFSSRGIPEDVAWYAYACAQCGYCVKECDQYYGRGWESQSPRGKWYWLKRYLQNKEELNQEQVDKFLVCTTCELCSFRCQIDLPVEESWGKMRGELIKERDYMTFPPFEIMAASLKKENNIWANYSKHRDAWIPEDIKPKIKEKAEIGYFAGCTASFIENDIAKGATYLLDKAGVDFTVLGKDEACCGIPMLVAGKWEIFEEIMEHNISYMKEKGVETVVTSCPACYLVWAEYYKEWAKKKGIDYPFEAKHYSEILAEKAKNGQLPLNKEMNEKITFHDSCHMGRALGVYEEPRELIKAVPGVDYREMEHNREEAHCCGSVLSLIGEPPVAYDLGSIRINEAKDVGAETILAVCPCCQFQLRVSNDKKKEGVKVRDLTSFVGEAMGIELSDPTGYALESWKTFEAMIKLMEPQNMADLMEELFPMMFKAIPGYMISMMKAAKKVPGMLSLMEKMMPAMMPILMPRLMPDVMLDMLKAVEKRVPMPDYMKEQLGELMPPAMENLLPKMLPDITPLVVPKMIDYIKENL